MNNQLKNLKLKIKRPKSLLFDIVGAIVLGAIIVGLVSFLWPKGAEAAWFDDNWNYRKAIAITNSSGSAQTDYQIAITIDTSTALIPDGKMRSDCGDLRTADSDGHQLSYWIEPTTCNTTTTKVWVKVASLPISGATVYIYYGNPIATTTSSTTNTFIREISNVQASYTIDESSGTNVADSSGNSLTGTSTHSDNIVDGKFSNARKIDAQGDANNRYISTIDSSLISPGSGNLTVEAWVYPTAIGTTQKQIYVNYGANTCDLVSLAINTSGNFVLLYRDGSCNAATVTGSVGATINNWYHVVGVKSGTTVTLYTNGSQDGTPDTNSSLGTITVSNGGLPQIGRWSSTGVDEQFYWYGYLDEVRVYNSTLSVDEVSDLHNNYGYTTTNYANKELVIKRAATEPTVGTLQGEESGPGKPRLYLSFNEGQGTVANDSSGQSNTGTLAGATLPTWQTEDLCISDKCLYFPGGTSGSVTVANTVSGVQSVSFWTRPASASASLMDLDGGTHYISASSGTITATGFSSPTIYVNGIVSSTLTANQWNYVEVTTGTGISASSIKVGNIGGNYLKGFMDEVKMYDSVRTAAQVQADYNSQGSIKGVSASLGGPSAGSGLPAWLSNGLVGYWRMDESSTGTAADSSGNGNTGTDTSTTVGNGKFSNGRTFNGSSAKVAVTDASTLQFDSGDFTTSLWAYPTVVSYGASDQGTLISKDYTGFELLIYQGVLSAYLGGASNAINSSTSLSPNTWYHFTLVRSGSTVSLYINGVLDTKGTNTASVSNIGTDINIGQRTGSSTYALSGNLDEVRAYNRALSPKEVSDLYNWAPGPVGYWNFEEKSGTAANDTSGRGKTGTLGGDGAGADVPSWSTGKYGGALNFDGGDYVNISASDDFDFNTGDFTYAAWVKTTQNCTGYKVYIGTYGGTPNSWLGCNNSTGNVLVYSRDSDNVQGNSGESTTSINDDTWHYITGVKKSNTLYIYVDGVLENSNTANFTGNHTSNATYDIGRNNTSDGYYANAVIDEVKIYNYARTQKQIVSDMNAGHPAVGSPVGSSVAHWKLDQGYGTNADDSTPNNNDLTLSSASWTNSGKFGKAFNGTNAVWLSRADDADFDVTATDDYAVSLWFKSDSADNPGVVEYLVNKANATTAGYAVYANTDGTICFGIDDDTTWGPDISSCTSTDVYDGTWHHLVAVRDYSNTDKTLIYIDGVLKDSDADSTTATLANSLSFYLGDRDGTDNGDEFSGDLDEVKVYRYTLTADEVKTEFNRGSSLVLGAAGNSSTYQAQAANQEYCVPGDTTSCAAPVGEWKFEEKTGTNANDTSGNGNTAVLGGDGAGTDLPTWTSGKTGGGLNFDGSDDYIDAGDISVIDGATALTITAWIKLNTTNTERFIFTKADWASNSPLALLFDNNDVSSGRNNVYRLVISDSDSNVNLASASNAAQSGIWQHLAITFSANSSTGARIYINGVEDANSPISTIGIDNINPSVLSVRIGEPTTTTNRNWDGSIDEVKVYNYARTPAQIAWDYNRGKPVAHWKFNECQGGSVYDSSGNNNTGTINLNTTGTQTTAIGNGTCTTNASTPWYNGRTGKFNSSLNFDGTDDYVDMGQVSTPTNAITISAWVYPRDTSTDGQRAVVKQLAIGSPWTTYDLVIKGYSSAGINPAFAVSLSNNSQYYTLPQTTTISADTWHHLVGTWSSGNKVKLYIDGRLAGQSTSNTPSLNLSYSASYNTVIGLNPNDGVYSDAKIDDVRIYNYALTSTQVKDLYNNGAVWFGPSTGTP